MKLITSSETHCTGLRLKGKSCPALYVNFPNAYLVKIARYIGEVEVWFHSFSTSALGGGEWLTSTCRLPYSPAKNRHTNLIRGWVDPRAGLEALEKRKNMLQLLGLEPRPFSP